VNENQRCNFQIRRDSVIKFYGNNLKTKSNCKITVITSDLVSFVKVKIVIE